MPKFNIRYRFIDKDTGEELSSAPNFMSNIKKDGNLVMVHTRANKVVHVSKAENMILQVATRKVNGKWLYETITPERNKETLLYKVKKWVGRFQRGKNLVTQLKGKL
jgi:hypothetical protein